MVWLKLLKGDTGAVREKCLHRDSLHGQRHLGKHSTTFLSWVIMPSCFAQALSLWTRQQSFPIPATLRGTPDMFHKHMSQILVLRLHLDCFDKWEHTRMLLPFSLDELFLFAVASELSMLLCSRSGSCFSVPWCTGLLEQEGNKMSLEAEKNIRLHTPWGWGRQKHCFLPLEGWYPTYFSPEALPFFCTTMLMIEVEFPSPVDVSLFSSQ